MPAIGTLGRSTAIAKEASIPTPTLSGSGIDARMAIATPDARPDLIQAGSLMQRAAGRFQTFPSNKETLGPRVPESPRSNLHN